MSTFRSSANLWSRCAQWVVLFCAACAACRSQEVSALTQAPPYSLFEYSTLTGSGDTITAVWIPVVTSAGKTIYQSMTLKFDVAGDGTLSLAPGYPQVIPTPPPNVKSFKAGKYVGPATLFNDEGLINVSGPGVTVGGATEWSLTTATGAYAYTYPQSATWYVGPLSSNPYVTRLNKAGITSTAYSYGIGGDCLCSSGNGGWYYSNSLLGVSQIGNTLTIVSFTDLSGVDHNEPVSQVVFTLSQ